MPIRIIRVKRPPGSEALLQEIALKLREFKVNGSTYVYYSPASEANRCIGCGKSGTFLCPWCKELADAAQRRSEKLMSTVEGRFAQRRFQ